MSNQLSTLLTEAEYCSCIIFLENYSNVTSRTECSKQQ